MRLSSPANVTRAIFPSLLTGVRRAIAGEVRVVRALLWWWPLWALLTCLLAAMTAAYQAPRAYAIDVGAPDDQAYVHNFHARVPDESPTYRWSDVYGYVSFPGLGGSRPFTVTLQLDTARPAPVTIIVNGETLFSRPLQPGWQTISLRVDEKHPRALASRDTIIEIRAPDYRTPDLPTEPKGIKLASVLLDQSRTGSFITPAYSTLVLLGGALLLVYLLVGRSLYGFGTIRRPRAWAILVALAFSVSLVLWLALSHIAASVASPHLVVTAVSALLLLIAVERLLGSSRYALSGAQRRVLAFSVAFAFGLRYGGMALPQSVIIDMPWHMKWLRTLLLGDWQSLYFPGGLSTVPREWGLDLLIPKSPLFYFIFAPLSALPFDIETSVKWLICFLDATLVLAVFWLVLRVGGSRWAAVAGAGLYAIVPLAFRAFSYGILPTILAQWLAACLVVALVAVGARLWTITQWAALMLLAAFALLSFPTVALFLTLTLLLWTAIRWLNRCGAGMAMTVWRIPALLLAGWALAIWAYYDLYISSVIASATALLAPRPQGGSTVRWPGGLFQLLAWTADYVVTLLPVLLAVLGFGLLLANPRIVADQRRTLWLVASWAAIAPLFLLVNYRVDMIGKHLFFVMLPVAVAGGVGLWSIARRGKWAAALAGLALVSIGWQAITFWVARLVEASS